MDRKMALAFFGSVAFGAEAACFSSRSRCSSSSCDFPGGALHRTFGFEMGPAVPQRAFADRQIRNRTAEPFLARALGWWISIRLAGGSDGPFSRSPAAAALAAAA